MTLRPYQQGAHDAVMEWVRKTTLPCVVDAATGAGKSHIIAAIAHTVHGMSGKRVLVIAPSAELVVQNHEKYTATGNRASIFSASAGEKSLRHDVVFGTPVTIKNKIKKFGPEFAVIMVDEAHGMTPTIRAIIDAIRAVNPNVRVVGLSATPYRMLTGYIYATRPDGTAVPEHQTRDPYFEKCVYQITARELIDLGWLTPPRIGASGAEAYHTLDMQLDRNGQFDAQEIDRAFVGQGRKTSAIIADIVAQSRDRKGVMIFAATVKHAHECVESLPADLTAIVTEKTGAKERKDILKRFKARKIKYLVNVAVLTTGFDAAHVDVIAILRATESVGLLQQIIGRGLRLDDGKFDCLVLDYAENIERHCPDGDIFDPEIKVSNAGVSADAEMVRCSCPSCGQLNEFAPRPNEGGFGIDDAGYFVDLDQNRVETEFGAMPAHYGRRCQTRTVERNAIVRCNYRWTFKNCPHCDEENDIAARHCYRCNGEIVDPNEKLRIEFKQLKKDPTRLQTDIVLDWSVNPSISQSGNQTDRVEVTTPYRSFVFWVLRVPKNNYQLVDRDNLDRLAGEMPKTITYRKDANSGFYRVLGYNRTPDEDPARDQDLRKPEVSRGVPHGAARAGNLF